MEEKSRADKQCRAAAAAGEKKRIRREVLALRDALSPMEQQRASCLITERLLGHQWFYLADILLCYVSYGSELDTGELLREALRLGKCVYVPRVLAGHRMAFQKIRDLGELHPGFHGIMEPPETASVYTGLHTRTERALMLMPGVAFDRYGNRLGYGGGYYDRYLADYPEFQTYSIGIGHGCQRVRQLPVEETDCKPYQVILV